MKFNWLRNKTLSSLIIVVPVFLALPLIYYIPTSYILELYASFLFLFYREKFHVSRKKISFAVLFFMYFIISSILSYDASNLGLNFFNENYRFFSFVLFTALFLNADFDYPQIARACLLCCKFHILFTIYEFVYINIISPGDYGNVILVAKAAEAYDENTQYLLPSDNIFSVAIRPLGLMLQPQKSGFVFVIGIVLQYILDVYSKRKTSIIWPILFSVAIGLVGAKTAFLAALLLDLIILLDIYPGKKLKPFQKMFFIFSSIITILFILIKGISFSFEDIIGGNTANSDLVNDTICFFNYPFYNWFVGIGLPYFSDLKAHGYACEIFYTRLIAQLGLPLFMILILYMCNTYRTNNSKVNFILLVVFLSMMIHYCIINAYFIGFCMVIIICFIQRYNLNEIKKI